MTDSNRALVLGAGGALGAAWTIGALSALEAEDGGDARDAGLLVGTSAGSVLSAALACGVDVATLRAGQVDAPLPEGAPAVEYDHDAAGALPPLPRPGIGSPRGVLRSALAPWRVTPMTAAAAALPQGRGSLEPVGRLVDAVHPGGSWAPHPRTWVVATDYDSGRRTVFGRPGAPEAALRDAVMASCAIPGWYAPVRIGGRRYVDGGTCSPTSLDLVARLPEAERPEEVVVLSPMTSLEYDSPGSVAGRLERRFRRLVTRRLLDEKRRVERTGTRVVLVCPTAEDLTAIGANLMDPSRREAVLETALRTTPRTLASRRARLAHAG